MSNKVNATIYGVVDKVIGLTDLRRLADGSEQIVASGDERTNIPTFQITWRDLEVKINFMPQNKISSHVQNMLHYIEYLQTETNKPLEQSVIDKLYAITQIIGVVITPTWDNKERCQNLILGLTYYYNGIFFVQDTFYDMTGNLLLGPSEARSKFFALTPTVDYMSQERKRRSQKILKSQNIPFNSMLPKIESEHTVHVRGVNEIAKRTIALILVALRGEGLDLQRFQKLVDYYAIASEFTPKEQQVVFLYSLTEKDQISLTWRYESCNVLLWSLGYISDLEMPDHMCNAKDIVRPLIERTSEQFLIDANLRPVNEILDQADLTYRYHWALQERKQQVMPFSTNLIPDVVYERHYTFNWLANYMNQEWDNITTDT